jgi:hypothetical protein
VNVTFNQPAFIEPIFEKIRAAADSPDESFLRMTLILIEVLKNELDISRETVPQSDIEIAGKGTALDLLFCCGERGRTVIEKGSHLYEIH